MNQQLPLKFSWQKGVDFEHYLAADNAECVQTLIDIISRDACQCVYLWSARVTGKSHLLQACCAHAAGLGYTSIYLPLHDRAHFSCDVLAGLEHTDLVCIDDIHCISAESTWQEALFHCYNRLKDSGSKLIVSANVSVMELPIELIDLKSRLGWGLVFHLRELSDELKIKVMKDRASLRGIELSSDVAQYLLKHFQRDLQSLMALLDRLDQASLSAQRKVTIPFIRSII